MDPVSKVHFGEVQAWEIGGNRRVWSHLNPDSMNWGPILTTAGGLVFGGGTNDRFFRALDASTGEVLWQFRTNSGITAPPVSFAVDGVQYIGVASGWGDPAFQQGVLSDLVVRRLACTLVGSMALAVVPAASGASRRSRSPRTS